MSDQRKLTLGSGGQCTVASPRETLFVREQRQEVEISVPDFSYEPTQAELNKKVFLPVTGDTLEERVESLARILFEPVHIRINRSEKRRPGGMTATNVSSRTGLNRRDLKKLAKAGVRTNRRKAIKLRADGNGDRDLNFVQDPFAPRRRSSRKS